MVDLVPILNSLCNFGMLMRKKLGNFVEFSEVSAPSMDQWQIRHPLQVEKVDGFSSGPLKHSDDKVSLLDKELLPFSSGWDGSADMVEFVISAEFDEG